MHNYTSLRASVAGASGYGGTELLRLLHRHPRVALHRVYAHGNAGLPLGAAVPSLARVVDRTLLPLEELATDDADVIFLALPHGEAMTRICGLAAAVRVVDLSGDFRLRDSARYGEYYGRPHTAPALLSGAVYGLPELGARNIASARLLANPGCYATAVTLALAPLAAERLLPPTVSVIAASGVSGAGRAVSGAMQFAEVNESMRAYKVGVHQHTPEIEQSLAEIGAAVRVAFVPHLLPVTRGIHVTATIPRPDGHTAATLAALYAGFYGAAPFVRLCAEPPRMKDVLHTNFCDIHVALDTHADTVVVLATIDNLVKGAAGQAVQNMNLMFGFPETEGLV